MKIRRDIGASLASLRMIWSNYHRRRVSLSYLQRHTLVIALLEKILGKRGEKRVTQRVRRCLWRCSSRAKGRPQYLHVRDFRCAFVVFFFGLSGEIFSSSIAEKKVALEGEIEEFKNREGERGRKLWGSGERGSFFFLEVSY